ncbi:MAG: cytochrome c-type biogenesis protein CcmH [Hyphomicrobiaceae bacterium]|nr:cytochrome c-type biogenesis protein CcmH [Hyphomicrobiaceae bacterium]
MVRFLTMVLPALVVFAFVSPALAVEPDEVLKDPALEDRARVISKDLRCLVCQNQSIDDSDAPLAKDLRVLVRERLKTGETNQQVIDFVVSKYGEFVLLKPRFGPHTLVLWLSAPIILLLGMFVMYRAYARRRADANRDKKTSLTAQEKRALNKLLKES